MTKSEQRKRQRDSAARLEEFSRAYVIGVGGAVLYLCLILASLYAFGTFLGPILFVAFLLLSLTLLIFIVNRTVRMVRLRRQIEQSTVQCAYCKDLIRSSSLYKCPSCKSPHHKECYEINHGCSTFACTLSAKPAEQMVDLKIKQ